MTGIRSHFLSRGDYGAMYLNIPTSIGGHTYQFGNLEHQITKLRNMSVPWACNQQSWMVDDRPVRIAEPGTTHNSRKIRILDADDRLSVWGIELDQRSTSHFDSSPVISDSSPWFANKLFHLCTFLYCWMAPDMSHTSDTTQILNASCSLSFHEWMRKSSLAKQKDEKFSAVKSR